MIRDLLPEIGIPHKFDRNGAKEWFWWASRFEDRCPEIRTDCWITLVDCGETAVDFTVISSHNGNLLQRKIDEALSRGVVPVVLEQGMLIRAKNGCLRALEEFSQEIRLQIPAKLKQLVGPRMTRERAAQIKKEKGK
jgi:hypothetical protein